MTPLASVFAAAIAGEDAALIEPLMESLEHDLLPRDDDAPAHLLAAAPVRLRPSSAPCASGSAKRRSAGTMSKESA